MGERIPVIAKLLGRPQLTLMLPLSPAMLKSLPMRYDWRCVQNSGGGGGEVAAFLARVQTLHLAS